MVQFGSLIRGMIHGARGVGGEEVRILVDSTKNQSYSTIYNLSQIYNIEAKLGQNLRFLPKSKKNSLQIYKILARQKWGIQLFFSRIYSLRID